MSFYWVYDLPSWLFGFLCTAAFTAFGLAGLHPTRNLARRLHKVEHSHNDIVSFYLAAMTVLYGITLGLVAIGTWTTYDTVENRVSQEAAVLGSMYRDATIYPDKIREAMQQDLRDYTRAVIDVAWPAMRTGKILNTADKAIDRLQDDFVAYEPTTMRGEIVHMEIYKKFNELIELRRARLNSVLAGIPMPLWIIVIVGALITIATTWFFDTASVSMHFWMTFMLSALLGMMIYLVATLDNPFRGPVGVQPTALEVVYRQTMQPKTIAETPVTP